MAPRKQKWRNSKEKEHLKEDIISGIVTLDMHPAIVYAMRDGEYHKFPFDRFKVNYRNLHQAIIKLKEAAQEDTRALEYSMQHWQDDEHGLNNNNMYPIWHNSVAKTLLIEDLKSNDIAAMAPAAIRQLRPKYMAYPPKVFRDHLNKEKKKPTIKAYWEHRRELKKRKQQGTKEE
jgi:hypothetical protein